MENKRHYRITIGAYSEIIESDRVEFMPTTGQTLFYLENTIMHIAPAAALVTDVHEQQIIINRHERASEFIRSERRKYDEFWKGFQERNKYFDTPDENISEDDKIGRIQMRERQRFFNEIEKYLISNN